VAQQGGANNAENVCWSRFLFAIYYLFCMSSCLNAYILLLILSSLSLLCFQSLHMYTVFIVLFAFLYIYIEKKKTDLSHTYYIATFLSLFSSFHCSFLYVIFISRTNSCPNFCSSFFFFFLFFSHICPDLLL